MRWCIIIECECQFLPGRCIIVYIETYTCKSCFEVSLEWRSVYRRILKSDVRMQKTDFSINNPSCLLPALARSHSRHIRAVPDRERPHKYRRADCDTRSPPVALRFCLVLSLYTSPADVGGELVAKSGRESRREQPADRHSLFHQRAHQLQGWRGARARLVCSRIMYMHDITMLVLDSPHGQLTIIIIMLYVFF